MIPGNIYIMIDKYYRRRFILCVDFPDKILSSAQSNNNTILSIEYLSLDGSIFSNTLHISYLEYESCTIADYGLVMKLDYYDS